jgi:phage terminase large subunit-like protein
VARDKRPEKLPTRDCAAMTLPEFIEFAGEGLIDVPWHLGRYLDLCSTFGETPLHMCVSMPPQHGKTTLIAYTIAWSLFRHPEWLFGYGSYGKQFSGFRTEDILRIYTHAGGELKADHARKDDWRTAGGGGCLAFSPGSGIAGYQMHHIVFDDFVESEVDLNSEGKRQAIHRDIDRATQRLWVGGSIVCIATRWNPEDPIGYLVNKGYDELNMPAVRVDPEDGKEYALWPEKKGLDWLDLKRDPASKEYVGEYAWATQYQGQPIPPEGALFGPPTWYDELPSGAQVVVIGFDFGYGPSGSSDHSVAVVLAIDGEGVYYVVDVKRVRCTLADMADRFRALMRDYPYPTRYGCYMGANEIGILNLLFLEDVAIERMPARHNKFTRAQRCAVAWRSGRVRVKRGAPWAGVFAREVEFFTGAENGTDDQVDALVSAFDLVELNAPVGWAGSGFAFGKSVM